MSGTVSKEPKNTIAQLALAGTDVLFVREQQTRTGTHVIVQQGNTFSFKVAPTVAQTRRNLTKAASSAGVRVATFG